MAVMIYGVLAQVWVRIAAEIAVTESRKVPRDPLRRAGIVLEEAGEAFKEAMDLTRDHAMNTTGITPQEAAMANAALDNVIRQKLREELVQTASAAMRVLAAMEAEDNGEVDS